MEFKECWPLLPGPKGWLRQDEARELYRLARDGEAKGAIVEIGGWMGRSTLTLAMGSKMGFKTPIYTVDPHQGSYVHRKRNVRETETTLRRNLKRFSVEKQVKVMVNTSVEAVKNWNRPVRLLWIDGHHDYPLIDYLLWEPHLVKGGSIGLHDVDHVGAKKVVRHFLTGSLKFTSTRQIVYSCFAEKAWPSRPTRARCPWDLLFITVNQWLNIIARNENAGKPWHRGLPHSWWRGKTKAEFLDQLLQHLDPFREPFWFKWEPITAAIKKEQAGNYRM